MEVKNMKINGIIIIVFFYNICTALNDPSCRRSLNPKTQANKQFLHQL